MKRHYFLNEDSCPFAERNSDWKKEDQVACRYNTLSIRVSGENAALISAALGQFKISRVQGFIEAQAGTQQNQLKKIKSSMPGKVLRILIHKGQQVEQGQPLLTLEAMKMENEIRSPIAGTLQELHVEEGKVVESGQLLAVVGIES